MTGMTAVNPMLALQKPLEEYIDYFEKLSPRSVRLLEKLAEPGMAFRGPFHDVRGVDSVIRIFEKMFSNVETPRFRVTDRAWGLDGHTVYLRWTFTFRLRGESRKIEGMSEVLFSPSGLVSAHTDHWDSASQLLAGFPYVGWIFRKVREKLGV